MSEYLELLAQVADSLAGRRIVVIGAAALRWHDPQFRGTLDLDLCIAIDAVEHARSDLLPAAWRRHANVLHRWTLPDGQLIDVIPASDELLAVGRVRWPDGTTIDLSGIDLAMHDNQRYHEQLPECVRVASRRALFVTKVVAWLDRPFDRQKDLGDIGNLVEDYAAYDDPRRWTDPRLEARDWAEASAFLLGSDLRAVCSDRQEQRIREFVARIGASESREQAWMLSASPAAWRADAREMQRRLQALVEGLGR